MAGKRIETLLAAYMPFPMCIVNSKGKVTRASARIDEVFIYNRIEEADIYALTGIKHAEFVKEQTGSLTLSRNGKVFRILTRNMDEDEHASTIIYFQDITNHETLKSLYNDERTCMIIVSVDNFDELSASTAEGNNAALLSAIDKTIRQWAATANAAIKRYKDSAYFLVIESASLEKLAENKFTILDDIRQVETETDFPITVSIGIGVGGKTPAKNDEYAQAALDLALGRGGDQAVIRRGNKTEYFGGRTQAVEKSNKGKSRIMAHAIRRLMEQSAKVIIMGHRAPDMDALGASIGMFRFAANAGKEAYIVLERYSDTLAEIVEQARTAEAYSFITNEKAMAMCNEETLLIVLDTHRPSLTQCPELLSKTDKIVVIDHHRKAEEFIENPTLAYMEPYASSTCELVTEILYYSQNKKAFNKLEAEALLAGITVDTNRFAGRTGVRTFEAASLLRRAGADTSTVKRFFQADKAMFQARAKCIAEAEFTEAGMAFAICDTTHPEMQIINAQAADVLLEAKGVKASFVAGIDGEGVTVVSARSLGEINVHVIMEAFGGGGHFMLAGAQSSEPPEAVIAAIKRMVE